LQDLIGWYDYAVSAYLFHQIIYRKFAKILLSFQQPSDNFCIFGDTVFLSDNNSSILASQDFIVIIWLL